MKTQRMILIILFFTARGLYFSSGVSFDQSPLQWAWQVIDPVLLKSDLLTSLWFDPAQPPLFNLFLGLVLQSTGDLSETVFAIFYLFMGLASMLLVFQLLWPFSKSVAFIITALWAVSPAMASLEQQQMQHHNRWPILIMIVLSGLALLRSIFHPALMACLILFVFFSTTYSRASLITLFFCINLLIVSVIKNGIYYSNWGTSSWFGMNLSKIALNGYSPEELAVFAKANNCSPQVSKPLFEEPSVYSPYFEELPALKLHAVSEQLYKENGNKNLHHHGYASLSKEYQKASLKLISKRPLNYLKSVGIAMAKFYYPVDELSGYSDRNFAIMSPYRTWFNALVLYQPTAWLQIFKRPVEAYPKWLKIALTPLVVSLIFLLAVTKYLHLLITNKKKLSIAIHIAVIISVYLFLAGNLLELGENMRFRLLTIPGLIIILFWYLQEIAPAYKKHEVG
jgi:hypothetical protein